MKRVGSFSNLAVLGVAAVATVLSVSSAQAIEGKAVVRAKRGTANFSEAGSPFQAVRVGQVLTSGATVQTGTSSLLDLYLGVNGPVVRVTADTTLALDKLTIDRTGVDVVIVTQLDLKAGTILGSVNKLAEASKYEVKTPYTVCAIKGTEYQISADGVHHVMQGSVLVAYTNPITKQVSTATVNAGQTFIPPKDPAPPGAVPTVVPTTNLPPGVPPPGEVPKLPEPGAPITVVPEPVQFVSPGTGVAPGSGQ